MEVKSVGTFPVILLKLVTPPLPPQTKLNLEQNGWKSVLFSATTLLGEVGGGGDGINPKPNKKLSSGAGSYVTIARKGFSHSPKFFCPPLYVQTDATLFANNSQHCWMLHVASVCTPCYMMLDVVAQSLKPVKLFSQQLPTFLLLPDRRDVAQQCWIRWHSSSNTWFTKAYGLFFPTMHCRSQHCWELLYPTPNTVGATMLGVVSVCP